MPFNYHYLPVKVFASSINTLKSTSLFSVRKDNPGTETRLDLEKSPKKKKKGKM